jgi:hypothetical protein
LIETRNKIPAASLLYGTKQSGRRSCSRSMGRHQGTRRCRWRSLDDRNWRWIMDRYYRLRVPISEAELGAPGLDHEAPIEDVYRIGVFSFDGGRYLATHCWISQSMCQSELDRTTRRGRTCRCPKRNLGRDTTAKVMPILGRAHTQILPCRRMLANILARISSVNSGRSSSSS